MWQSVESVLHKWEFPFRPVRLGVTICQSTFVGIPVCGMLVDAVWKGDEGVSPEHHIRSQSIMVHVGYNSVILCLLGGEVKVCVH